MNQQRTLNWITPALLVLCGGSIILGLITIVMGPPGRPEFSGKWIGNGAKDPVQEQANDDSAFLADPETATLIEKIKASSNAFEWANSLKDASEAANNARREGRDDAALGADRAKERAFERIARRVPEQFQGKSSDLADAAPGLRQAAKETQEPLEKASYAGVASIAEAKDDEGRREAAATTLTEIGSAAGQTQLPRDFEPVVRMAELGGQGQAVLQDLEAAAKSNNPAAVGAAARRLAEVAKEMKDEVAKASRDGKLARNPKGYLIPTLAVAAGLAKAGGLLNNPELKEAVTKLVESATALRDIALAAQALAPAVSPKKLAVIAAVTAICEVLKALFGLDVDLGINIPGPKIGSGGNRKTSGGDGRKKENSAKSNKGKGQPGKGGAGGFDPKKRAAEVARKGNLNPQEQQALEQAAQRAADQAGPGR
jgi:hypothetical protein